MTLRTTMILSCVLLACACRPVQEEPNPPTSEGGAEAEAETETEGPTATSLEALPAALRARGMVRVAADDEAAPAIDNPDISMRMLLKHDGSWYAVPPGTTLRSFDRYALELTLREHACLYLLFSDSHGQSGQLFPSAGEDPCIDAGQHRIPDASSDMPDIQLDDTTGTETIYLIASDRPIADADATLAGLIADAAAGKNPDISVTELKAGASEGAPAPTSEPSGAEKVREQAKRGTRRAYAINSHDLRERGSFRARAEGASVDAKTAEDGIVVIPYSFEHTD